MSRLIKIYAISRLVFDCWIYVKQSLIVFLQTETLSSAFLALKELRQSCPVSKRRIECVILYLSFFWR